MVLIPIPTKRIRNNKQSCLNMLHYRKSENTLH